MKGKLIVIEGTDGSGKRTQTEILVKRLRQNGFPAESISFPQYGKKSAGLVEEYLNGAYGNTEKINPYAASLFYALDRFDASFIVSKLLKENKLVICDRYTDSSAGHQGGKIKTAKERKKFVNWLYDLEYRILGIPEPDLVIILHLPTAVSFRLIDLKGKRAYLKGARRDKHEKNLEHLQNAEKAYLWLAKLKPENHKLVECTENGNLLSPQAIGEKIYELVSHLIIA